MRSQAVVAVVFLLAAAASGSEYRKLSPFVRRNLVQQQSSRAQFSPARSHYMGRHPRRLADGDCTTNPAVCAAGTQCCDGVCVDLSSNTNNCGHCRYKCSFSLGCCGGSCVNLQTDSSNCGACGSTCTTAACSMGLCAYAG
ncbi:hypothetical protein Mapa_015210 [Marchantia paleacea]|nr:hypothetical protein Mapa_015210 [Marchantia paleacea]